MRRLLVDGNNVMGARPDGWWRDRAGARRRLLDSLEAHAERTGTSITVVFDGREGDLASERVEVRFAAHADDLLAELAAPDATLVTSDRELGRRARSRGAEVIGSGGFRAQLDRGG